MNRKTALLTITVMAASTFAGSAAMANPIYLGYRLGNATTITQVGTGEGFASVGGITAGNFTISLTGTGAPTVSQGSLSSNTLTVTSTAAGGTITLYVSETGNTGNIASFTTGFGNNSLSTESVVETSYATSGNTPFAMGNQLSTSTVPPGTQSSTLTALAPAGLTSPFTVTDVYTVTFAADGTSLRQVNATLNIQANAAAVPEPATLALLGTALVGMGVVRRRKNNT